MAMSWPSFSLPPSVINALSSWHPDSLCLIQTCVLSSVLLFEGTKCDSLAEIELYLLSFAFFLLLLLSLYFSFFFLFLSVAFSLLRFNPRQIWLCILWPFHFTNADKRSTYRTYARKERSESSVLFLSHNKQNVLQNQIEGRPNATAYRTVHLLSILAFSLTWQRHKRNREDFSLYPYWLPLSLEFQANAPKVAASCYNLFFFKDSVCLTNSENGAETEGKINCDVKEETERLKNKKKQAKRRE